VIVFSVTKPVDGAVFSLTHMPGAAPDARPHATMPGPARGWFQPSTSSSAPAVRNVPDPPPRA
jgi:hypothetical protein